jgi:hypothetical protein
MSQSNAEATLTQHAMLVVWGEFARHLGLVQAMEAIPLGQKTCTHRPQTKVLEFLVAVLAGLPHLTDISHAAHPLDQDRAVAQAWGQAAWADASGVSRTLQALTPQEVQALIRVLETISQPFIDHEVALALCQPGRLVYDGDLTGRPVSNASTSYPDVAYGHMSDEIRLGYQAALVSLHSPTYGRLWLSVQSHPGDTVACTQTEALVRAAEARTGVRPRRRVELVQARLRMLEQERQQAQARLKSGQEALAEVQTRLTELAQASQQWQAETSRLEGEYAAHERPERPTSRLAQARQRLASLQRRHARQAQRVQHAQRQVEGHQARLAQVCAAEAAHLERLRRYEQENAANPAPIQAVFRLDAGFSSGENVALLIELGYEVYTKPYNHQVTARLQRQVTAATTWTRVGANAEMVAFSSQSITGCPYPLDLALERFYTGQTVRYSTLVHYGREPVTTDLAGWFAAYNGRQTIEAGIKEGKGVFQMHHLKVRSRPALLLQEHLAAFAANFVRWAAHWLTTQCQQVSERSGAARPVRVKEAVQVGAHTSAWVKRLADGWLVQFTEHSAYVGRVLYTGARAFQLPLPLFESCDFSPI